MKQKTITALILATVILTAAFGFVWLYSAPESEGQAVLWQSRRAVIQQPVQYKPPTPVTQPSDCGTCRKWSACGFNVDQLMVNGKGANCIDAYKAASQGIQYCGKTITGQSCDPYGQMRHLCVCR